MSADAFVAYGAPVLALAMGLAGAAFVWRANRPSMPSIGLGKAEDQRDSVSNPSIYPSLDLEIYDDRVLDGTHAGKRPSTHRNMEGIDWSRFAPLEVDPEIVYLVKAAALVERNSAKYASYLKRLFGDDPIFCSAIDLWGIGDTVHSDALGRWAELVDPAWSFQTALSRYQAGYDIALDVSASTRGGRVGELIARCMVEAGTSSYYSSLRDLTSEPVMKEICRRIAADSYRHFKLFYEHLQRYLDRENISFIQRLRVLRVALVRIEESEDGELAYAFHCGNEDASVPYDRDRCMTAYLGRATGIFRFRHVERSIRMIFKTIGLEPRGRMADIVAKGFWQLLQRRRYRYQQALRRAVNGNAGVFAQAA